MFLPIDPIFVNHYLSQFASNQSFSQSMQIEINNDLQILDQWAKTWLVDFNPKKTKALIISNNTNIPELNIRFNDESVELVDNHKHLGLTVSKQSRQIA
jgi:hypothetical protein